MVKHEVQYLPDRKQYLLDGMPLQTNDLVEISMGESWLPAVIQINHDAKRWPLLVIVEHTHAHCVTANDRLRWPGGKLPLSQELG